MLYQGAVRFMKKRFYTQKDMEGSNALIRAQDIILELTYALFRSGISIAVMNPAL